MHEEIAEFSLKKAQELEKTYPDKKFYLLLFVTLDFSQLENFNFIECFVNTACPRIAIDDASGWKKPIVNPNELEIALGIKDWENYKMEELE